MVPEGASSTEYLAPRLKGPYGAAELVTFFLCTVRVRFGGEPPELLCKGQDLGTPYCSVESSSTIV